MRQMLHIVMTAMIGLLLVTGCGGSKGEKKAPTKEMIQKRKAAFEQKLQSALSAGMEINATTEGYRLKVKDGRAAARAMLKWIGIERMAADQEPDLAILLQDATAVLEVDWQKYASDAPESVYLYYAGNGRESVKLQQILREKKIGAYLSFDAKDRLSKARLKDIDEKHASQRGEMTLQLKGALFEITKQPENDTQAPSYLIDGGQFFLQFDSNLSGRLSISYQNPHCVTDRESRYLGKWQSDLPQLHISNEGGTQEAFTVTLHEAQVAHTLATEQKKLAAEGHFKIGKVTLAGGAHGKSAKGEISNILLQGKASDINESVIAAIYALYDTAQAPTEQMVRKSMVLLGDLFSGGMQISYLFSADSALLDTQARGKKTHFVLEGLQEKGELRYADRIDYQDTIGLKTVQLTQEGRKLFGLYGVESHMALKGLYNIIPEVMRFSAKITENNRSKGLTPQDQQQLSALSSRMVNTGFEMALSPVRIDGVEIPEIGVKYDAVELDLDARIKPNKVQMNNPLSSMMLLSYLAADGKLVLSRADLEKMAQQFPPQLLAMIMMYAKYEGDKAIFEMRFDNGHLMVNDKPVM